MDNFDLAREYFLEGCIFLEAENFSDAEFKFKKSLELMPGRASTLINLSVAQLKLKKYSEAKSTAGKSILIDSINSEAYLNLGYIEKELNNLESALKCFDKALSLKPDYAEAWSNKGNTLNELKRYDDALAHYDRALSLKPDYAEAWLNKGNALNTLKRYDDALAHYDRALSLKPDYAEAWLNKGIVLYGIAHVLDARSCIEKALEQKPNFHKAKWAKLFTSIPVLFLGNENLQEIREIFSSELEKLDKLFLEENVYEAYEVIGAIQPFYLAYQVLNNKDLLDKYGQFCCRLMNNWQKVHKLQNGIKQGNGKIKVGIVGEQIRNHSVWNAITKGFVFNLDASKFEIHIFHLGNIIDEETHSARVKAASFTNSGSSLLGWAKVITEKNVDVLLYPEICMDQFTTQLACLRLAPIQIAAWGHPETTGLPTIDYYLSAELFENESSQDAYTETLVILPNLGCSYLRLPIVATNFGFERLGISSNEPILICPGAPYKYSPQYDWILVEIVKRLGKTKLIFFNFENHLSELLKSRLDRVFNEANLVLNDHVLFVPFLKPAEFYGLMKCADVFLDTIGFSGFNTTMQAVDCSLPIVTREGQFLRGRLASGILKKIGLSELIANTDEEYVELAVRLAQDKIYQNHISSKLIQKRDLLYDDDKPILALEDFLIKKCRLVDADS